MCQRASLNGGYVNTPRGCEHLADLPGNPPVSTQSGAKSDATGAPNPAPSPKPTPAMPDDLADVVAVWADLPAALRAGILAMVKAAKGGEA